SSSSARSRSDSVRGLIPSSERSSSQKRWLPAARSRISRSVHFPQTISAVRQTGQFELEFALIAGKAAASGGQPLASPSVATWLHLLKLWSRDQRREVTGSIERTVIVYTTSLFP